MAKKRWRAFAPSTSAASYSSLSMALRPASSSRVKKGMPFQMLTAMTLGMANPGSDNQPTEREMIPSPCKSGLSVPNKGSKMPRQVRAVTTSGTIQGSNIKADSILRSGSLLFSNEAIMSPTMVLMPTDSTVKRIVLSNEPVNCSSDNSRM